MKDAKQYLERLFNYAALVMAVVLGCIIIGKTIPLLSESKLGAELGWQIKNWQIHLESVMLQQQFPVISYTKDQYETKEGTIKEQFTKATFYSLPLFSFLEQEGTAGVQKAADPAYAQYIAEQEFKETYGHLLGEAVMENQIPEHELVKAEEEMEGSEIAAAENPSTSSEVSAVNTIGKKGIEYSLDKLGDFDFLLNTFYTVHSSTTVNSGLLNAKTLLSKDFKLTGNNSSPQILIYHTHSQEEYKDYATGNKDATIVGVGNYLTKLLTEQYGYSVIHDTTVYDLVNGELDRNKAYTYALDGITKILQENPSIEVVIDLHRDGVREDLHLVTEVNGKSTAKIMLFNGISQNAQGSIEHLNNPYREDNLGFSLQMQLKAASNYPEFMRKIYLKGLRYNLHLRARSTLIEVGAQTNSYEEAKNAMEPLADMLNTVLSGQ